LKGLTVVHYRIAYTILMPEYTWSMWTACMTKYYFRFIAEFRNLAGKPVP